MKLRNLIFVSLLTGAVIHNPAQAEVVSIDRGKGHGFLFGENGQCYIFLPSHVLGRSSRLTFELGSGVKAGKAEVIADRIQTMDLALAEVTEEATKDCGTPWQTMISWPFSPANSVSEVVLKQVPKAGRIKNIYMRVAEADTTSFDAQVAIQDPTNEVHQGTSGSIAFLDDVAFGMAIEARDQWEAKFLAVSSIIPVVAKELNWSQVPDSDFDSDISPSLRIPVGSEQPEKAPAQPRYPYDDTINPTKSFEKEESK